MYTFEEMYEITKRVMQYLQLTARNGLNSNDNREDAIRLMLSMAADLFVGSVLAVLKPAGKPVLTDEDVDFMSKQVSRISLFLTDMIEASAKTYIFPQSNDEHLLNWRTKDLTVRQNTSAFDSFVENDLFKDDDDDFYEAIPV